MRYPLGRTVTHNCPQTLALLGLARDGVWPRQVDSGRQGEMDVLVATTPHRDRILALVLKLAM